MSFTCQSETLCNYVFHSSFNYNYDGYRYKETQEAVSIYSVAQPEGWGENKEVERQVEEAMKVRLP